MEICLQRILALMEENNTTNSELSNYIHCASSAISEWKTGKIKTYQKYIVEIADYFDVSADYLLGRTDLRKGGEWDDLIKQYQLCADEKKNLVNRLLGLVLSDNGLPKRVELKDEEDMSAAIELLSLFDQLNLLGKSRVISAAISQLDAK